MTATQRCFGDSASFTDNRNRMKVYGCLQDMVDFYAPSHIDIEDFLIR